MEFQLRMVARTIGLSLLTAIILCNPSYIIADGLIISVRGQGNLDPSSANTTIPVDPLSFEQLSNSASYQTIVYVTTSLATTHGIFVFFFHTAAETWVVRLYTDAGEVGGTSGQPALIGSAGLIFTSTGDRANVPTVDITSTPAWVGRAPLEYIYFLFDPLTQLSGASNIFFTVPDENPAAACIQTDNCTNEVIQFTRANCLALHNSCPVRQQSLGVSADELASRAITAERCTDASSVGLQRCRRCYDRAANRIPEEKDRVIFRGLLTRAANIVDRKKRANCR